MRLAAKKDAHGCAQNKGSRVIFDPRNGCSGDMVIASLVDLGVGGACEFAEKILKAAGAEGKVRADKFRQGTQMKIELTKDISDFDGAFEKCLELEMPAQIREFAKKTISQMTGFEREIHGAHYHLHELNSADTLVDVFTSAYCLHKFNFDAKSLPIALGSGQVRTAHGLMENPPPLGRRFLAARKFPTTRKNVNFEISTPTGIAVLSSLQPLEKIEGKILKTGTGYGTAEIAGHDNCLKVHEVDTPGKEKQNE